MGRFEESGIGLSESEGSEAQPAAHESRPSAHEIRAELTRVLESRTFEAAASQRKFLRYAVEQTLAGHPELLKEYCIGIEVFTRKETFDPKEDSIVRAEARRLRAKLAAYYEGEGLSNPIRIELPKGGYTAVFHVRPSDVAPASDGSAAPVPDSPATLGAARQADSAPARSLKLRTIVALVAAVAVGTLAGYFFWQTRHANAGAIRDSRFIAVLPFTNLGGTENAAFTEGLTEDLLDSLTQVQGLHVIARTSSFQFRGKDVDVREIGRRLNVGAVVEGTVRRYQDRLRVTAQLSDASNGYQLWAGSYDRELKDALAIQRELSQSITNALGTALAKKSRGTASGALPSLIPSGGSSAPVSPQAYREYLSGLYYRASATRDGANNAMTHFQQAVTIDPGYAPAYAAMAEDYAAILTDTTTAPQEILTRMRAAAAKSVELAPELGMAHSALGMALNYQRNWKAAEIEFRKGIELSPGNAETYRAYAGLLVKLGRVEEALNQQRMALDLDPLSPQQSRAVGLYLYYSRHYDESIEQYRQALALAPNDWGSHRGLGRAYIQKGMYAEGIKETQTALQVIVDDPVTPAQLAYAYARSGDSTKARQLLNEIIERGKTKPLRAMTVAIAYVGLNEKNLAFEWLRKSVDQQEVSLLLKADPVFDPLRSDPRFTQLLQMMNLN